MHAAVRTRRVEEPKRRSKHARVPMPELRTDPCGSDLHPQGVLSIWFRIVVNPTVSSGDGTPATIRCPDQFVYLLNPALTLKAFARQMVPPAHLCGKYIKPRYTYCCDCHTFTVFPH